VSSTGVPFPSCLRAERTTAKQHADRRGGCGVNGEPAAVRERANRPAVLRYAAGTGSCSLSVAWPAAFQPSRPSLNVRTFV
jgi:hypothetical protein